MGKLNAELLRKLQSEDFRVLTAVEMAMRNHEIVPLPVVRQMAQVRREGISKLLRGLCSYKLVSYERSKKFDGYRLTNMGYDFLALNVLRKRGSLAGFGHQIGVGKESNIYIVCGEDGQELVLKLHRLGRTCFRNIKDLRDYHGRRKYASWLYLSRISATKEYAYLKALYDREFPVPKPIDFNRHCVVMTLVKGTPLTHVMQLEDVEALYDALMNLIVRFAEYGVIHGDFNEFNIMITEDEKPVIIDFPQMMSTSHQNAEMYFNRDVECIKTFFKRRFDYESELFPTFSDIERTDSLDKLVRCSGFTKEMSIDMEEVLQVKSEIGDLSEEEEEEEGEEEEEDKDDCEEDDDGDREEEQHGEDDREEAEHAASDSEKKDECKTESESERIKKSKIQTLKDLMRMPESMKNNLRISGDEAEEDCKADDDDDLSVNQNVSDDGGEPDESDRLTNRSFLSTASTIPPDEIKRRLKHQIKAKARKAARKMCKVKGEDSAAARNRMECRDAIKWSATDMWGLE